MIRLPLDIVACYEAMRERAAKNASFDLLANIKERIRKVTAENAELQNEIIRLRVKLRDYGCEL